MRVRAVSLTGAFVLAAAGLIAGPTGVAQAAPCAGGFDANGDGVQDAVFGMPSEDVGSPVKKDAGVVTIVYGQSATHTFSTGSQLITEELAGGGTSETGDRFGAAVAVGDLNDDGCKDLVIGVPGENSRQGRIVVVYAKSDGSGLDLASSTSINQNTLPGSPVAEVGDDFGASLAFQGNTSGATYLWVGSPGENIGKIKGAGEVFRFTAGVGGTKMSLTSGITGYYQGNSGVPGSAEEGDRFGEVLSGSAYSMLVGVPKEDIGSGTSRHVDAGMVMVFTNAWSYFTQETTNVPGGSERGDLFGASVAQIPSCNTADAANEAYVVGSPGEGVGTQGQAGYVTVVDLPAVSALSLVQGDQAGVNLVQGQLEAGDGFGFKLAASGTLLAVGSPFEDVGTSVSGRNAGSVYQARMGCNGSVPTVTAHATYSAAQSGSTALKGDRFGLELGFNKVNDAVADLVVGAPLKADGSTNDAGRVIVYRTLTAPDGVFAATPVSNLGQSTTGIVGSEEVGDQFGAVISNNG